MPIVAVTGDCTTTTCVALAAVWPADDAVVVEADPTGGSLAAWLDTPATPSLATIVANVGGEGVRSTAETVAAMTQRGPSGIRFVAAPARAAAAHRALDEAATIVLPALGAATSLTIADCGRARATDPVAVAVALASVVVVVHRQDRSSAGAAAVRLERLVELVEPLAGVQGRIVVAVIGDQPFDPDEITAFVDASVPGLVDGWAVIADDVLSAAVIAGRVGVSEKRLRRLPLLRSVEELAPTIRAAMASSPAGATGVGG
jgi:MinD-like ATPase involved in chromosome partitioning or flagellar assembly